jgi:hypothetical protein
MRKVTARSTEVTKGRREVEDRLRQLVADVANRLDLGWLDISVTFRDDSTDDTPLCEELGDWHYRRAALRWSVTHAASATDEELHGAAVHELVHALIGPLWDSLPDKQQTELTKLNELATENVTRAILALWT